MGSSLVPHFPLSFCLSFVCIQDAQLLLRQTPGAPPRHRQLPQIPDEGSLKSRHSRTVEGEFLPKCIVSGLQNSQCLPLSPPSLASATLSTFASTALGDTPGLACTGHPQHASAGIAQGARLYLSPSKGLGCGPWSGAFSTPNERVTWQCRLHLGVRCACESGRHQAQFGEKKQCLIQLRRHGCVVC